MQDLTDLLKGSGFLLFDEPFSGLDICVLDKVVDMQRAGATRRYC